MGNPLPPARSPYECPACGALPGHQRPDVERVSFNERVEVLAVDADVSRAVARRVLIALGYRDEE